MICFNSLFVFISYFVLFFHYYCCSFYTLALLILFSRYVSYLTDYWGVPSNGAEFAIASAGITLGGMFGSLLAGIVSDTVFFSRRQPVAFMGMFGLTGVLLMIRFSSTVWMGACAIGLSAFFFSSAHGIVTSTCAMDFAGAEATGTAVGLLDGVQKVGSE